MISLLGVGTSRAKAQSAPTGVVISEFRFGGPGGAQDEFIELANPGTASVDMTGYTLVAGTVTAPLAGINFSGKIIPAGGHLLLTNAGGYSLNASATGDITYTGDIALGSTLTLKNAAGAVVDTVSNLSLTAAPSSPTNQYSYTRRLELGYPAHTGNDVADFNLVDTSGTQSTVDGTGVGPLTGARLGAPGPQNSLSPIQNNTGLPNTAMNIPGVYPIARYASKGSTIDTTGRVTIRRTITNNTGTTATLLRFRIVAGTTGNSTTSGIANLRAISSGGVRYYDANNVIQQAAVGMTIDAPTTPTEVPLTATSGTRGNGGGLGSSWTAPLPTGGLAPGASINVEFLFGIVSEGNYRVVVDAEVLPPPPTPIGLYIVSTGSGKITLYWEKVLGAKGYNVYRSTSSGGEDYARPLNSTLVAGTPSYSGSVTLMFTDTGLTNGTEYFYTVKTVATDNTQSVPSDEDSDIVDPNAIPWDSRDPAQILGVARTIADASNYLDDDPIQPTDDFTIMGPDGALYENGSSQQLLPSGTLDQSGNFTLRDGTSIALAGPSASDPDTSGSSSASLALRSVHPGTIHPRQFPRFLSGGPYHGTTTGPGYREASCDVILGNTVITGNIKNFVDPKRRAIKTSENAFACINSDNDPLNTSSTRKDRVGNADFGLIYGPGSNGRWRPYLEMHPEGSALPGKNGGKPDRPIRVFYGDRMTYSSGDQVRLHYWIQNTGSTVKSRKRLSMMRTSSITDGGEFAAAFGAPIKGHDVSGDVRLTRFMQIGQAPGKGWLRTGSYMTGFGWDLCRLWGVGDRQPHLWGQRLPNDLPQTYGSNPSSQPFDAPVSSPTSTTVIAWWKEQGIYIGPLK